MRQASYRTCLPDNCAGAAPARSPNADSPILPSRNRSTAAPVAGVGFEPTSSGPVSYQAALSCTPAAPGQVRPRSSTAPRCRPSHVPRACGAISRPRVARCSAAELRTERGVAWQRFLFGPLGTPTANRGVSGVRLYGPLTWIALSQTCSAGAHMVHSSPPEPPALRTVRNTRAAPGIHA